ncbi:MAG: ribosome silencing factor, partial [Pseudomonadota bacterium]
MFTTIFSNTTCISPNNTLKEKTLATSSKPKSLLDVIIDALEDIKAKDIRVLDVAKITSVSDFLAIASADSTRQTRALASNVMEKVREAGFGIYGTEGGDSGEWVLVDCGDVVVHIMQPAIREYYKLEELYQEGKVVFPRSKPVAGRKTKEKQATKQVSKAAKKDAVT